jgi:serine/threonine protein phosphatase 1
MPQNFTYVVADIHGRYDCLKIALAAITADAPNGTVVFTGDYVDRGPQSRQVIERLMAGPPEGWRWVCLKGNHEDMMVTTWAGQFHPSWWIDNGGETTMLSYGHPYRGSTEDIRAIPVEHIRWANELPTLHQDQHRIFVHAGVDPTLPLDQQDDQIRLWMRKDCPLGHGDHHVIHGHTPYKDGPKVTPGRTNLDTMAFRTGRLVVAVFDDEVSGPPLRFLECQA